LVVCRTPEIAEIPTRGDFLRIEDALAIGGAALIGIAAR
jgi:hypothetical protein